MRRPRRSGAGSHAGGLELLEQALRADTRPQQRVVRSLAPPQVLGDDQRPLAADHIGDGRDLAPAVGQACDLDHQVDGFGDQLRHILLRHIGHTLKRQIHQL